MTEPAKGGPPKGRVVDMETALDKFYEACSFDMEKAIPTTEKFEELEMDDVSEKLYSLNC